MNNKETPDMFSNSPKAEDGSEERDCRAMQREAQRELELAEMHRAMEKAELAKYVAYQQKEALRAKLAIPMKARKQVYDQKTAKDRKDGQEPAAKKSKMAKKLENCPGVKKASASGKIMRPLPHIWNESARPVSKLEPVPKAEPKLETEAEAKKEQWTPVEEWFPEDLYHVGEAPGLNITFDARRDDGNAGRAESMVKAFDKVGLRSRLWQDEEIQAQPFTPQPRMAGLPHDLPQADVLGDDLSGTIPWQGVEQNRSEGERRQATASNQGHTVVEVAHHHHVHLQPAPIPAHLSPHRHCHVTPANLMFVDDCSRASYCPDESRRPPTASYRAVACPGGQAAASPAPCSQRPAPELSHQASFEDEEKKFNESLARMLARAEVHRMESAKKKGSHNHDCGGDVV